MEITAAIAGIGAAALTDPAFLLAWLIAGVIGTSLRHTLFLSFLASFALRSFFFAYFCFQDVVLPLPNYMLLMYIVTVIVGIVVSVLVYHAKKKFTKSPT